jgi:hypothetical protein
LQPMQTVSNLRERGLLTQANLGAED